MALTLGKASTQIQKNGAPTRKIWPDSRNFAEKTQNLTSPETRGKTLSDCPKLLRLLKYITAQKDLVRLRKISPGTEKTG